MLMVVTSSTTLLELMVRQEFDVEQAIEHAIWASRTLVEAAGGAMPE